VRKSTSYPESILAQARSRLSLASSQATRFLILDSSLSIKKLMSNESLLPKHGGYRKLKSFQVAQLAVDVTVRFVERYIGRFSRTRDQMVQAARSGVQNIAEGSQASATSKKTELKLTQVARASLEELVLDYEDFLFFLPVDTK
jgi:hypothetical protein